MTTSSSGSVGASSGAAPPPNARVDYQLGGAYTPALGVTVVSRDRKAKPAPGLYNICYVNGFQIQPGEESYWSATHPALILRDRTGIPVVDTEWKEELLDIRRADARTELATIVGSWIRECREAGFDAVEIDNLDSYSRSQGLLQPEQAVRTMRLFADQAHALGMAIAQKNSAELVPRRAELGTDFAVSEECNRYGECSDYTAGYGDHVIVIEYRRPDFEAGCRAFPNLSIVLRDVKLVTSTSNGYVYDGC